MEIGNSDKKRDSTKKEEKDVTDGVPSFHTGISRRSPQFNGARQFRSIIDAMIPIGRGQRELMTTMGLYIKERELLKRPPGSEAYPGDVFVAQGQQLYNQGSGATSFSIENVVPSDLDRHISLAQAHIEKVNNLKGQQQQQQYGRETLDSHSPFRRAELSESDRQGILSNRLEVKHKSS